MCVTLSSPGVKLWHPCIPLPAVCGAIGGVGRGPRNIDAIRSASALTSPTHIIGDDRLGWLVWSESLFDGVSMLFYSDPRIGRCT